MTYAETVRYLYNLAPLFQEIGAGAYKEGLSNSLALDAHFGHPHRSYRTIHVAGTNGKGSCAHTLAAMLQHRGLKVGLYTSPHLTDFRERIRVNGVMMPEQYLVDFVESERAFFEPLHPSFFEITTALAFKFFADQGVDVAVIEVGLGGRLDCTNIITPVLSLITNISLDHTQFLGDTLEKIAAEKAGIIKPGVPVVIGEAVPETRPIFTRRAAEAGAPVRFAEDVPEVLTSSLDAEGLRRYVTRSFGELHGELAGECQTRNANSLLCAARVLRPLFGLTPEDVRYAFRHVCHATGLQGRWQTLRRSPLVVCDTGHNPGGWQYLAQSLRQACGQFAHVRIVFGMAADKDIRHVLALLPAQAVYYWATASVRRAMDADLIRTAAESFHLAGNAYPTVAQAFQTALAQASPEDMVFVGGSNFVVADLLAQQGCLTNSIPANPAGQ